MLKRRVLLVEDHPMYRQALAKMLEDTGRFQIVGEAANGHQAIQLADIHHPELIVIDVHLPGITGLQIARVLRKQLHRARIVFLSMHIDDNRLIEAIKVGANAYLVKEADAQEIVDTIRRVMAGENPINQVVMARPDLARRVVTEFRAMTTDPEAAKAHTMPLSARELQVLDCVAQGFSNKEIADELFVTEKTVRNHMTSVLRKLNAEDRFQAVLAAVREGWIELGPQEYARVEPPQVA